MVLGYSVVLSYMYSHTRHCVPGSERGHVGGGAVGFRRCARGPASGRGRQYLTVYRVRRDRRERLA